MSEKERLQQVIERFKGQADYLEVRLEDSYNLQIDVKKGRVDSVNRDIIYGGNVRALYRGGWGLVVFKGLDELESAMEKAILQAKLVGRGESKWALLDPVNYVSKLEFVNDPREVSLKEKIRLLRDYTGIVDSFHPEIIASQGSYSEKIGNVLFANSEGSITHQERVDNFMYVTAIAVRGSDTQATSHIVGAGLNFNEFYHQEDKIKEKCQLTVDLLDAPRIKGGQYTVILNPDLTGVFAHESFGHTVEADFVADNPGMREALQIGKVFGPEFLSIYDSGVLPGLRGSYAYDDEGTPAEKTYLLKNGKLVSYLHSRETAAKLGAKPTGSARAVSYQFPPIPRMRNTIIEGGGVSFQDMIKDIELGVYAIDPKGGKGGENFSFTAHHGYMIRNGKVAELIQGFTLAGNLFKTLKNIEMVGNDEEVKNSGGGCGKGGQFPLPVTDGGPHLRIKNVVIGGEE